MIGIITRMRFEPSHIPYHTVPYHMTPYHLITYHKETFSYRLISSHLILSHLISSHLISSHHLILSHYISSNLNSSHHLIYTCKRSSSYLVLFFVKLCFITIITSFKMPICPGAHGTSPHYKKVSVMKFSLSSFNLKNSQNTRMIASDFHQI